MDFVISEKIKAAPGIRFCNYVMDLFFRILVYFLLLFSLAAVGGIISGLTGNKVLLEWVGTLNFWNFYLCWVIASFLYYYTTEVLLSRSIAKFITGTIVVLEDGSPPKRLAVAKRTLCRFVPIIDFVSFLFVNGWHDAASNTFVVKKKIFEKTRTIFYSFNELGNAEL